MDVEERLKAQLEYLKSEHKDLDEAIVRLSEQPLVDQLALKRMKKRKLSLRDMIMKVESMLVPDIIA